MPAGPPLQKRLGQHHLRHPGLCRPLLEFLQPRRRRVVEIGPGGGVLTGELLRAGAEVWAWEIDPAWAFHLGRRWRRAKLGLVAGDVLDLPWARLPASCRVAGNLPYAVATKIITDLLAAAVGVELAGFLVQLEVARRLAAPPGDGDYGALSVLVQAQATVSVLGRVRRGSFRPPPRVDGAFIGLRRRQLVVPAADWPRFAALVRLAFAGRRKILRNTLGGRWGGRPAAELLAAVGLEPRARAGELGVGDFVRLHREAAARGLDAVS